MYCKETVTEFGSCQLFLFCNFSCLAFFFPSSRQTHRLLLHVSHSSPPEKKPKQNNWFSVSEPWYSTITESRQPTVIYLGPSTPVFKQRLDQIMKGILWHGFLFIAEAQLKKSVPLCDHTAHGDIKELLLPYSLTCFLFRQGKFYLHHTQ